MAIAHGVIARGVVRRKGRAALGKGDGHGALAAMENADGKAAAGAHGLQRARPITKLGISQVYVAPAQGSTLRPAGVSSAIGGYDLAMGGAIVGTAFAVSYVVGYAFAVRGALAVGGMAMRSEVVVGGDGVAVGGMCQCVALTAGPHVVTTGHSP